MKAETAYLIRLLRAFIQGEAPPPPPEGLDDGDLVRLASAGDIGGIIGYMLQPFADMLTPKTARLSACQFYGTVGNFANKGVACDRLLCELRAAEIPFAVLKGAVLGHLYPMRELRTFGDVDVYVPAAYKDALRRLVAADTVTFTDETQLCINRPPLHIEFHFDPTVDVVEDMPALKAYLAEIEAHFVMWQGIETVDPLYHFIYLLSHQMRHFADDSPGLRSYLDLAVFLKSDIAPDAAALTPLLQQLGLYPYAQMALTLTERWFSVPSPLEQAALSDGDATFLATYIADAGQFARQQNPRAVEVEQRGSRMTVLWRALFPTKQTMYENPLYAPYAEKWLPLAYLYRLYRGAFQRSDYALKAAKDITTADKDAAVRRRAKQLLYVGGNDVEKR